MPKFRCKVAVPTALLYEGEVGYANVPGCEGAFGVLANHEMFVSNDDPGVLTLWLDEEGKERRRFVLAGGFAQVFNNNLSVLGRHGIAVEDIDSAAVSAEEAKLNETLADLKAQLAENPDDGALATHIDACQADLKWCEVQLKALQA